MADTTQFRNYTTRYDPGMGLDLICDALNLGLYIGVDAAADASPTISSAIIKFLQSGTGAKATDLQTRERLVVFLTDFYANGTSGAAADMTGVTDSTGAIKAARDALPAAGGELITPAGTVLFSENVIFTNPIRFRALGGSASSGTTVGTVFKKAASLNAAGFTFRGQNSAFEGFSMVGVAGNGGDGIVIEGGRICGRDFSVTLMGQDGVRIGDDAGTYNANLWRLDHASLYFNGRYGLQVSSDSDAGSWAAATPNANGGTATNLDIHNNTSDGMFLDYCGANTYIGTLLSANGGYGLHIGGSAQWESFHGGDMNEANVSGDVIIDAASGSNPQGNSFFGCDIGTFTDNSTGSQKTVRVDYKTTELYGKTSGTFTPTIVGSTTPGTQTYSAQAGFYKTFGDVTWFTLYVTLATLDASAAGNARIAGLPVTQANNSLMHAICEVIESGVTPTSTSYTKIVGNIAPNTNYIELYQCGSGLATGILAITRLSGTASLRISGTIFTA